jgi:hypothetical protein
MKLASGYTGGLREGLGKRGHEPEEEIHLGKYERTVILPSPELLH